MLVRDLFTLRLFVLACDLRSVTKAAQILNLAVSAASRRIQLLEHEADAPLLTRLPHGIEPTPLGLTILEHAREMIRAGELLDASLDEHRSGVRGHLRIWASMSVLQERLAADITKYLQTHPNVRIDLQERTSSATLEALLNKQTDIGIIVQDLPTDGLTKFEYNSHTLAVALPPGHPMAGQTQLRFLDLLDEDFISLEPHSVTYRTLVEEARRYGRSLRTRVHVTSFGVMCSMISRGLGIAIAPSGALAVFGRSLGISIVPLDEPWVCRPHAICVRRLDELDAAARGFIAFLRHPRQDEQTIKSS